jgi:hypothetical protein
MKKHRGMRAHDIVILLKIIVKGNRPWFVKDIAYELGISQSEVSESLNRSKIASLLSGDKKQILKQNLLDFLEHGLQYVFPAEIGSIQRGMPTAHSAPPLDKIIAGEEIFVWPWANGKIRGQAIEPLHPRVPEACAKDTRLYEFLALVDALRLGKAREKKQAISELRLKIIEKSG